MLWPGALPWSPHPTNSAHIELCLCTFAYVPFPAKMPFPLSSQICLKSPLSPDTSYTFSAQEASPWTLSSTVPCFTHGHLYGQLPRSLGTVFCKCKASSPWAPPDGGCFSGVLMIVLLFTSPSALHGPPSSLISTHSGLCLNMASFFFYVLVFWLRGMWDLSSLTRDQTRTPCIGRQSLNHWTAREVPCPIFLIEI